MTEEQIFLAILDLPNPADGAAYLEKACGGDVRFRRQVEELLAAHFKGGAFLDEPVGKPIRAGSALTENDVTLSRGGDPGEETAADHYRPDQEPEYLHFLLPSTRRDSLGRIGHYEVLQVLGKGGFGIVFRAFDELLERVVALKVLATEIAATSPARKRFLREARSSAQVRHENVVQVYAVEEQPLPYLVMEFIPGETLQERLNRTGPLDAPEIVRLGRQIAEGLAAAHATGLIHRDIKPANVLIEAGLQARVKITDFGLARAADDASMTQSGVVAGTPLYMAPEQAQGHTLDHRADLFSLGSVLYTVATGRPPFRAANTFAVLKRVVEDNPRPIRELIPEMPQWLVDVIVKLHAKKPEDRFQSAREIADVLADCEARLRTNDKDQDFSPIPQSKLAAERSGRWKWVAAAALLLPIVALLLTEIAGRRHWFQGGHATTVIELGHHPEPMPAAQEETVHASSKREQMNAGVGKTASGANDKSAQTAIRPFTDSDVVRIAALPAAEQVEEVRKELMQRNPGFDGKVDSKLSDSVVTELRFNTDKVTDISPVRTFNALRVLDCSGTQLDGRRGTGQLADLTPLEKMNLADLTQLRLGWTKVSDAGLTCFMRCKKLTILVLPGTQVSDKGLGYFQNCKGLTVLHLDGTRVSGTGLAYFKDCKDLTILGLNDTQVSDAGLMNLRDCKHLTALGLNATQVSDSSLLQLRDCENLMNLSLINTQVSDTGLTYLTPCKSLTTLNIVNTRITDFSPLSGLHLKQLDCDFNPDRDAEILSGIKTLETINGKAAKEFLKEADGTK